MKRGSNNSVQAAQDCVFLFFLNQWPGALDEQGGSSASRARRRVCVTAWAAILGIAGCSPAPVVTITNHSSVTLSNVVVSGAGFSNHVDNIVEGKRKRLTVHPSGNTGLRVAFDTRGHHVDSGQQAYFQAADNSRVSAVVNTDLNVSVSTDFQAKRGHEKSEKSALTLIPITCTNEGGRRLISFEFRVPPGERVTVDRSALVIDRGEAWEMRGPPHWAKQSDPAGKMYGPGTRSIFCITDPADDRQRLWLQTTVFDVGPRAWVWKVKRAWQTKKLSAVKASPPPMGLTCEQSEPLSFYFGQPDGAAKRSEPLAESKL